MDQPESIKTLWEWSKQFWAIFVCIKNKLEILFLEQINFFLNQQDVLNKHGEYRFKACKKDLIREEKREPYRFPIF